MATSADVIKKYGSMEAFKAANPATTPVVPVKPTVVIGWAIWTANALGGTQNTPPITPITTPNSSTFSNNSSYATSTAVPSATRAEPTVATPANPVISKTNTNDVVYDEANPQDYLDQLLAKTTATKKQPTQTELYNYYKAQRAVVDKANKVSTTDPFVGNTKTSQAQLDEALLAEKNRDNTALWAYKTQLDAQYWIMADQTTQAWQKRKDAEQRVYSFSWFGRSTAAADAQGQIEKETQSALSALEAAKQAEIRAKQAELEWADSDTVAALRSQVWAYQKASQDYQIEAIKKTTEANAKSGADFDTAFNNILKTISDNAIDIWDPKVVEAYAKIARNADGTVNEGVIKALPADVQAIIRSAVQTSQPKKWNYKYIDANKYNWAWYFNEDTGEFVPLDVAKARWIGNGTGWWTGGSIAWTIASAIDTVMNDPNLGYSVWGWSTIAGIPWTPQYSFNAKVDNLVNNLVLPNLKYLKGATSDKDIEFIKWASTRLKTWLPEKEFRDALQELRDKYGSIDNGAKAWWTTTNTGKAPAQWVAAPATTAPAKNNTPSSSAWVDYLLSLTDD
jgi:hypothetical protein